jgi:uncharacterized protein YdeI (YjbR/CyaY-like superfamily)
VTRTSSRDPRSQDREEVLVETRAQWRRWLRTHHATSQGIWLVRWKQSTGRPAPNYDDVVEEALCFGWVDSRPRSMDHDRSALLLTPRRRGSRWSATNKERVERLTRAGLMRPAGLALVEAAKADGTWSALDDVETLVEPDDLVAALTSVRGATAEWAAFPRSTRRAILEWLSTSRTEATRQARLRRIAGDAAAGIRTNQWRQPKRPQRPEHGP